MAKKVAAKVVITQDEEQVVEKSVLAQAILEISKSMKRLLASGLNREAVLTLTLAAVKPTGSRFNKKKPTRSEVESVFNALAQLEREYAN